MKEKVYGGIELFFFLLEFGLDFGILFFSTVLGYWLFHSCLNIEAGRVFIIIFSFIIPIYLDYYL